MADPLTPRPDESVALHLAPRPVAGSIALHTTTVLPEDTNAYGNLFGGHLVELIDKTASITASRHARRNVVTASIDRVDFHAPVKLGDILTVESRLTYTGRTSMEIATVAWAENRISGARVHACEALLTFVAIDDAGHPTPVPALEPVTDEERRLFELGRQRAAARRAAKG
jgi:acyl-CoA hydrolase